MAEAAEGGNGQEVVEPAVEGGEGAEQEQEYVGGFDVLAQQGAVVDLQFAQALLIVFHPLPKGRPLLSALIAQAVPFFEGLLKLEKFFFGAELFFAPHDFACQGDELFFLSIAGAEQELAHLFLELVGVGPDGGAGVFEVLLFIWGEG